ncbi:hypothetical protein BD309DRAFT_868431 [Dichomitus squalens]|uniref:Fungal-type protein kinase domain-containing protein n=1 Tax=Dichomitus squalens TaxID=114155 RepID=A0A4Q9NJ94_9APHY|nr:hypothetical protein BD309DRAFT_868431 [Dichomitus squalens]TBU57051.1 hypothetical protein BD310DRAFT_822469 [Dichomitus squalens]
MWLVDKLRLCRTYSLSLEPLAQNGEQWGRLQPISDRRPAWARPQVFFLFTTSFPSPEAYSDIIEKFEHQFILQHLTSIYMVIMDRYCMRLMRYDRAGSILTPWKDYTRDPTVLPDLFWRLSVLTDEQLGLDPTAIPILPGSSEDVFMDDLARKRVDTDISWREGSTIPDIIDSPDPASAPQWSYARSWFGDSIYPAQDPMAIPDFAHDHPRWKLLVPSGADVPPREFLVGVPIAFRCSEKRDVKVDERNTRVFVAYDCTARQLVCLKDTWRADKEDTYQAEREGTVLEKLNGAGVPFVPTLICDADLPGQETRTQRFWPIGDIHDCAKDPVQRAHYRLATKELCMHLCEVKRSRTLVSIIGDCVTAHASAAELVNILHADISYDNIMICPTVDSTTNPAKPTVKWRGMLIDWEFPRPVPTPENLLAVARITSRRSWKYASVEYMQAEQRALQTQDELESFFYVLLDGAVRHLPSNLESVREFVDAFFATTPSQNYPHGWSVSPWKLDALDQCRILRAPARDGSQLQFYWHSRRGGDEDGAEPIDHAFNALLQEYLSWCHGVRRVHCDSKLWHREYLPPAEPNPAIKKLDVGELAAKLDDHGAVLALFQSALKAWPEYLVDVAPPAVVKPEPREDGEAFWRAMALQGGVGEGTAPAATESEVLARDARMQMLKISAEERRERAVETRKEDAAKEKMREAGAASVKPPPRKTKPRVNLPVRSSRRIRGEPATDPDEPPSKRRRRR